MRRASLLESRSPGWTLPMVAAFALSMAGVATVEAQTTDENGRRLYLYAAEDFGIDPTEVTFARDIAPILQRSCQNCHRPGGAGPMSLVTYEEVRPWARAIMLRTAIRDRMGAMPPWYVEKDIGIQHYKQDPSLSDEELAKIQAWAENGAPMGDPADLPPPLAFDDESWRIKPDIIVKSEPITVKGDDPDWWGEIPSIPIPLEKDRYVKAVEIREVMDEQEEGDGRATVGGRYIVHHMIWRTEVPGTREITSWPVHEVGRNPDLFDENAGRLLKAGSQITSESVHLHSNGRTTTAHLEIGTDIDIRGEQSNQQLRALTVTRAPTKVVSFEPHLHAPGERMCLEATWGFKTETLACVGYDHNWVRTYVFEDDYQPLLPPGTVLTITGYMNNSETNANVPDPRNWQGAGNRSVGNMFIDLGERVTMTPEQFVEEMQERVKKFGLTKNDYVIGCPLCLALVPTPGPRPDSHLAQPGAPAADGAATSAAGGN